MHTINHFFQKYILAPSKERTVLLVLSCLYFLTHLFSLTLLPVFADEAIYIRWTQLIMDEPLRYAFFALNDGKTPLFIWLMLPFQYVFSDQLLAGRLVSVIVGFLQVLLTRQFIRSVNGSRGTQLVGMVLVSLLPYWYFHHRMALMDGLLALCLTATIYASLRVVSGVAELSQHKKQSLVTEFWQLATTQTITIWTLLGAFSFGAALWSKLPAVLLVPGIVFCIFVQPAKTWWEWFKRAVPLGAIIFGGICIFALLKLHPAFGQLFSRGGDFLYPLSDFFNGSWIVSLQQLPNYLSYYIHYLSAGTMFLLVFGTFLPHSKRRIVIVLTLIGLSFIAPIALLGKVVYARYLLPAVPFFTLAAVLTFESIWRQMLNSKVASGLRLQAKILVILSCLFFAATIIPNLSASLFAASKTPFVPSDTTQYLTEWSSGHGIKETTDLIEVAAKKEKIAIATEGYFGTLPDGMLLYLHRRNVQNIMLEGIGQPVVSIPAEFAQKAANYDKVWLVVNSHRMKIALPKNKLIAEYCRPFDAPCLQVWDITDDLPAISK